MSRLPILGQLERERRPRVPVLLVRPVINVELNSPFFLPLGLLCVASVLRDAGHPVEIIDYEYLYRVGRLRVDGDYLAAMCDPLIRESPRVIGITVLADTVPLALLMGRHIKRREPGITVVLGGPGVFGTFPDLLNRFPDSVDYICQSEGELAMLELVDALGGGETQPAIAGMYGRVAGQAVDFGGREFAVLDELAIPAYDMLPVPDYLRIASPRIFDVYLGSGCTYACKFCVTSTFWGRDFRSKSPGAVLRELDALHEAYGIRQFNFLHDNFANKKDYLNDFIDYFIERNTRYEWGCAVRPDNVSQEQLARMKQAGCFSIFCGTDSGSAKILRKMSKMPSSKRSYQFFEDCLAVGVRFETNTIIGYPDEEDADLEASLAVVFDAVAYGATSADVSILQPLPGAAVTLAHLDDLVYVEEPQFGTFLPAEVLEMTRADPQLFPGFSFIRSNNRPFAYYRAVVSLVRYFTRHFTHTVRLLREHCGVPYVALFDWMASEREPGRFAERFRAFVFGDGLEERHRALARAVFTYEAARELLRGVDVAKEIENVYSPPELAAGVRRHVLVDLDFAVDRIVAEPPAFLVSEEGARPTCYLFALNERHEEVVLSLTDWQRRLWLRMEANGAAPEAEDLVEEFVEPLAAAPGRSAEVTSAVTNACELFSRLLQVDAKPVAAWTEEQVAAPKLTTPC